MIILDGKLIKVENRDIVNKCLKIPEGIKSIANNAFSENNNIKKIYIPKSLSEIYYTTFENCKKLKTIEFDENVKIIPDFSFSSLSITSVKLPKNLEVVGNSAFSGSKLENVVFPNTVKQIGSAAFNSCYCLKNVTLPQNLSIIENSLFSHCNKLKKVTMPENVSKIKSGAFLNCSSLDKFKIPTTIPRIEKLTFKGCSSLKSIHIPQNISVIEEESFSNCYSLKNVTFESGIKKLEERSFKNSGIVNMELPEGLITIESAAFTNCKSLKSITIPDTVVDLKSYAFRNCKKLENVKLPKNLTVISESLFENCSALKEITLPENIVSIEDYAFNGCFSLKKLIIPDSVKNIGENAFKYCHSIEEIYFPDEASSLGSLDGNSLLYFTKEKKGFTLSAEKKPDSIPIESFYVNPLFLSKYWTFKDSILKEQKNISIANFYNNILMKQPENIIRDFLQNHNFTFYKQIQKINEFNGNSSAMLKLLYTLGGLNKSFELNGKKYDYSQKVGEFILEKIRKGKLNLDLVNDICSKLKPNGFKKEFTDFFMENYDKLIIEQFSDQDFIAKCYNLFEKVQETNTNNHGKQRQLKPTIEKFKDYFLLNKFKGTTDENKHIALEISKFYKEQEAFDYAVAIDNERINNNVPNNILGFHLAEENPFANIDKYEKKIIDSEFKIMKNLSYVTDEQFTFDWLEKNDPKNFILGKYCSCCSHIEGAGFGIMHASIVNPNVQNLVIRNKNNKIIAKSTLYINPQKHYGVFNNVEINTNYLDYETKNIIYKKYINAVNTFAKEYNKIHKDNPLYKINVGMGFNDLDDIIAKNNKKENNLLKAINYGEYGVEYLNYSGDSDEEQYTIWENNELNNNENNNENNIEYEK